MRQRFFFFSMCPGCKRVREIETYTRGELLRLLELGHPIQARCAECDMQWTVGPEGRVQVARRVAASFSAWRDTNQRGSAPDQQSG